MLTVSSLSTVRIARAAEVVLYFKYFCYKRVVVYLPSRSYVVSYVFFCHAAKASVRAKRRIDSTRSVRSLHLERLLWVRSRTSRARREGLAEHSYKSNLKKNARLFVSLQNCL